MAESSARVLVYDIETSPNLGYVWGKWRENVIEFKDQWYILSFAYKWLGERETHAMALPDFPLYQTEPANDRELVIALRDLFVQADVTVTHNGVAFDNKKAQTRMFVHDIDPPGWYKEVDTLKVARKQFAFTSNRLSDLCHALDLPVKEDSGGFKTWLGCMNGDPVAWDRLRRYNKKDVVILEKLYKRMIPWLVNYPHMGAFKGRPDNCPKCGKGPLIIRGYKYNQVTRRVSFQCKNCGGYSMGRKLATSAGVGRGTLNTKGATMDWHVDLKEVAILAQTAGDPDTKNAACLWQDGALLMATKATNTIPLGLAFKPERLKRPDKYEWIEHAERHCIYKAARLGIKTAGTTMICPWAACIECARAIICAGIIRLVTLTPTAEHAYPKWDEEIAKAMRMLAEVHIEVIYVDGPLEVKVKRNGELVSL